MKIKCRINGEELQEFDERNAILMDHIGDNLVQESKKEFELDGFESHCLLGEDLPDEQLEQFCDLIEEGLGELYIRHKGEDWKSEKEFELTEPGLAVVWFTEKASDDLVGFLAFKVCLDDEDKLVLYLYEIHISEAFKGMGRGSSLIKQFHDFCVLLHSSHNPLYKHLQGTSLTVFAENSRAHQWYTSLGYSLTKGSPRDKVLRSGKVIKPAYYLMRRKLKRE
ncbi:NAT4 [[Candida] subhashii]|uniref:NAT4 n=1 Tax=[Candida] subhashii TaxID=561895 RepID=A0A8J5R4F9_9ASCO|nr:NAT4 [[Candida] subhashii]KAG7665260.1 NAT4 [[Candida] subhashii]